MTLFVLLCLLLVVLTVVAIAAPLLGWQRKRDEPRQDAQNIVIARERLRELDNALGSNEIDQAAYDAARLELEQALAKQLTLSATPAGEARAPWVAAALCTVIALPAVLLYWQLGTPSALTPSAPQAPTQQQILAMVDGLAQRLQTDRDDAQGWSMLAESYMVLQQYEQAEGAVRELQRLEGDTPEILLRLADAVAMRQQANLNGEPIRLVEQALKSEPNNVRALWMAGMAARQRNDNTVAVAYWQRLRPLIQNQPQAIAELDQLLNRALADAELASNPQGGGEGLQVRVSIATDLAAKLEPDNILYVYARAVTGPAMPLAVVKRPVGELPATITLSDAQAMSPTMKLSAFDEVVVVARVSKSGDAKPQSGDLQGQTDKVDQRQTRAVDVTIDSIR